MSTANTSDATRRLTARLLSQVLQSGVIERTALARRLAMLPSDLDQCVEGTAPLPIERQFALAGFAIERIPALRRDGHRLRAYVLAAIHQEVSVSERLADPPSRSRFWR